MGAKRCAVHDDLAAVAACRQCSKELCKSCVMVTPAGTFCSSECSVLHRELTSQSGPGRKSSGAGVKAVLLLLLLVAAAFAVHLAPATTGTSYDVIGLILKQAP